MNVPVPAPAPLSKERRVRVYPRLNQALQRRLAAYCAAKGITVREAIEEAVTRYLDTSSPESAANIFGQLQRIALALEADRDERQRAHLETHHAVEILSEAFGRFVRLWMYAHAAALQQPATRESAEVGYKQFLAMVARAFRRGHRFVHDLPKEGDPIHGAKT